jgi:hypothetical protein
MSYTKRHFENLMTQSPDEWIDVEYEYWRQHRIELMEEALGEQGDDYYEEIKDEDFEKDLNEYYDNYNQIWQ